MKLCLFQVTELEVLLYTVCTGLNLEDWTCSTRCKLPFDVLSYSIFVS